VENGPQGQDGYTLLTGDDVSVFVPCICDSWAVNPIYGTPGWRSSPTVFEWQSLSSPLPILSDHHRRAATGLAAGRLAWFDTGQIREMPRGKLTCGCRGWGHVLEDRRDARVWVGGIEKGEHKVGVREIDAWRPDLCAVGCAGFVGVCMTSVKDPTGRFLFITRELYPEPL
jgi:hypothetical protein